ncbi:MAG TPA: nitrite reductase small subunit NirD [Azoarcus sp.]|nr:nitrite reductase small subunit NirD [Azoarcus sp.]
MSDTTAKLVWHHVCAVEDIPKLGARRLEETPHGPVAIFRNNEDEVFALLDRCPHKNGPLSAGIVHGRSVTCPLHNWRIQFEDGQAMEPDVGCTRHFAVKTEDGQVMIQL